MIVNGLGKLGRTGQTNMAVKSGFKRAVGSALKEIELHDLN